MVALEARLKHRVRLGRALQKRSSWEVFERGVSDIGIDARTHHHRLETRLDTQGARIKLKVKKQKEEDMLSYELETINKHTGEVKIYEGEIGVVTEKSFCKGELLTETAAEVTVDKINDWPIESARGAEVNCGPHWYLEGTQRRVGEITSLTTEEANTVTYFVTTLTNRIIRTGITDTPSNYYRKGHIRVIARDVNTGDETRVKVTGNWADIHWGKFSTLEVCTEVRRVAKDVRKDYFLGQILPTIERAGHSYAAVRAAYISGLRKGRRKRIKDPKRNILPFPERVAM